MDFADTRNSMDSDENMDLEMGNVTNRGNLDNTKNAMDDQITADAHGSDDNNNGKFVLTDSEDENDH